MESSDVPRRARLDQMTPAERAIYDAVQAVEAMPTDVRLTDAVVLLGGARESVADYVDGIEQRRRYIRDEQPAPPNDPLAYLDDRVCPYCGILGCRIVEMHSRAQGRAAHARRQWPAAPDAALVERLRGVSAGMTQVLRLGDAWADMFAKLDTIRLWQNEIDAVLGLLALAEGDGQ